MCTSWGACGGGACEHKRCSQRSEALDPLELKLQAIVNHQTWVLGTKLRFFASVMHALTCQTVLQHLNCRYILYGGRGTDKVL